VYASCTFTRFATAALLMAVIDKDTNFLHGGGGGHGAENPYAPQQNSADPAPYS
jgi:hypothetical protein